jgi:uncharacterized protein (DUF885 family)
MKAVDALTINDEFRLRKWIAEQENRLKNVPKVEQLQEQLASRMIEQDSIKRSIYKLQKEKELQEQYYREREMEMNQKYEEQIKQMNEQINHIMKMMQYNPVLAQALAWPRDK